MKFFILILLVSISLIGFSQSNYTKMQTGHEGTGAVYFVSDLEGYIGTSNIVKTTNGGVSWNIIYNATQQIDDIQFVNTDTAYAMCVWGQFLKSFNGGTSWNSSTITADAIYTLKFVNGKKGFLGGQIKVGGVGAIFRTTDAGLNWSITQTHPNSSIYDIFFLNQNEGYAVGSEFSGGGGGLIYKTSNGGTTWTETVITLPGANLIFRGVTFLNSNTGFIVGQDINGSTQSMVVYTTQNGGTTWTPSYLGTGGELYSISFITPQVGYISGLTFGPTGCGESKIFKTINGGSTWVLENTVSTIHGTQVMHFPSANVGYIFETCSGPGVMGEFFKVTPDISTVTKEGIKKPLIKCYPNPVQDLITLESPDPMYEVIFYSVYGVAQHKDHLQHVNTAQVAVPDLENGIYFIEVKTANSTFKDYIYIQK